MYFLGRSSENPLCAWLAAGAVVALLASPADADVVNKYTFNDNTAKDSVGFDDGTIVDNTGISTFTGGALNLSANGTGGTVAGSNQDFSLPTTVGAYVDLPNGVFTRAVSAGTFGAVSLEIWATPQENRNWARLVDFGTSDGGENISGGAGGASYVLMVPQNGIDGRAAASTHNATGENLASAGAALSPNVRHHMVATLDQNDTGGGTRPNGTLALYVDNGAPVLAAIRPPLFLDLMNDNNNWLGRAQWPDPLFDGLIDEFRIHDKALTAAEVNASFLTGPDPVSLPVLVVNRTTGGISLTNPATGGVQVKGYSIASAAGSLNPASWASIDADNTFDFNGGWTTSSLTAANIAESNTVGPSLDGGLLTQGNPRSIGTPWVKAPFEDVVFNYTLGDGTTGSGLVQYTGNAPLRSDLNGDGAVNPADWALFSANSFTAFPADLAVAAYRKGDLDGDKDNDYFDFTRFKSDYVQHNGVAAFNALVGVVPEPGSTLLAVLASTALIGARRRRSA